MPQHLLPTTVVGSYPQPDWLVNREMLSHSVPRVRMNIWRVPEAHLEQAFRTGLEGVERLRAALGVVQAVVGDLERAIRHADHRQLFARDPVYREAFRNAARSIAAVSRSSTSFMSMTDAKSCDALSL